MAIVTTTAMTMATLCSERSCAKAHTFWSSNSYSFVAVYICMFVCVLCELLLLSLTIWTSIWSTLCAKSRDLNVHVYLFGTLFLEFKLADWLSCYEFVIFSELQLFFSSFFQFCFEAINYLFHFHFHYEWAFFPHFIGRFNFYTLFCIQNLLLAGMHYTFICFILFDYIVASLA